MASLTWFLRLPAWENVKSHSLHLFDVSTVRFQHPFENALSGRKVTLVAFVWLFSRVGFQIKVSSYADAKSHWFHLFDLFPLCVFKCLFKWSAWEDAKSHWLHLFDFSPLCVFKCLFKWSAWEDAKSHWLQLFDFSPPTPCHLIWVPYSNTAHGRLIKYYPWKKRKKSRGNGSFFVG